MNDGRLHEIQQLLPRAMTRDWVRLGARLVRLMRDRRHESQHEAIVDRLLDQARQSVALRESRAKALPGVSYPPSLPISVRRDDIVTAIRNHRVVVIAGETGSGKTTQIPKMCLEAGLGVEAMIGCTQPRRVAAMSISRRLAEELEVPWGREVGCKIRFDDRTGAQTYVKLMTDGILLAETQNDPLLTEYNAIIIDEAHERSLNIDFLLGYLKGLLVQRTDLKLIITSATIDTGAFSRAFDQAPIIEVSGRTFPVEVRYEPIDPDSEERGEVTFVDAAVQSAARVLDESIRGDVLIFLPGERDIREAVDLLEGRFGSDIDVVPLYGRLGGNDQQRVFAPSAVRKVVVATNIAETSLTIPGIRFVIDAGLARISRYNARTRTRRLPIEPVSQSSANQRKGRAGRVEAGVCIRLFSEDDFNARPAHTQPEIQRANLAEVILRMKAFRLGEMETFPFLNPPTPAAIAGGYTLLHELGALDDQRQLTSLGYSLARLPIDPTLGRMLMQAREEGTTRELLIIASGLSVQDPRERPLDQQTAADTAHRRFQHPQSDFLGLLRLWDAVHQQWEGLRTQGQRRRFCRENFWSYLRMREWQDLQAQLEDALHELIEEAPSSRADAPDRNRLDTARATEVGGLGDRRYDAIHRAVLAGLLGHVALRVERNQFRTTGQREVTLFPGSALFVRTEPIRKGKPPRDRTTPTESKSASATWIVAGEIVETSQLFARTVAMVNPEWIPELAPHLVKVSHEHPRWLASAGQVVVDELIWFQGLLVRRRRMAYAKLNPTEARSLFIRSALVEEGLLSGGTRAVDEEYGDPEMEVRVGTVELRRQAPVPPRYAFLEHQRRLREKMETWQTRVRHRGTLDPDQALFDFYTERLPQVSSVAELDRWLGVPEHAKRLLATEADLTAGQKLEFAEEEFPEWIELAGTSVRVRYAYAPGEDHDGATLEVPLGLADHATGATLDWAIPGLRAQLVEAWLRALPKSARRQLQPIPPKVAEIVQELRPEAATLAHDLASFVRRRYGIALATEEASLAQVDPHLRPRFEVWDAERRVVASGRDWSALRSALPKVVPPRPTESADWRRAAAQWERYGLQGWSIGDVPERVVVSSVSGKTVYAWPGLEREGNHVNLRLYGSLAQAQQGIATGVAFWIEQALQKDLAWLEKDLRALARCANTYASLGSLSDLQTMAFENLRRFVLEPAKPPTLQKQVFDELVAQSRARIPGLAMRMVDRVAEILELRQQVARRIGEGASPAPSGRGVVAKSLQDLEAKLSEASRRVGNPSPSSPWATELAALVPAQFLEKIEFERLQHVPRYLKALLLRIERASTNPPKDQERARQVAPWVSALRELEQKSPEGPWPVGVSLEEFRWMIEEFKVSLFAQELGTAVPVSSQRLAAYLERLRGR